MPSPELKPCPFCGGEAEISATGDYDEIVVSVRCTECTARVRLADDSRDRDFDKLKAEAVAAWNRRAADVKKKRNTKGC